MSRSGSRYGSHSSDHHSGRSRRRHPHANDRHNGPPVSMWNNPNPFAAGSSSRRPSAGIPPPHHSDQHFHTQERQPSLRRSSSSRHADEHIVFNNPFGSSSHFHRSGSHHGSSRSSASMRPRPLERRGGEDLSSAAHNFYDPFDGQLGTGRYRESIVGDPELPRYRSASEYHRSVSRAPGYDVRGMPMRASRERPPPYTSFDSHNGGGPPQQFPPTRRPSRYDRFDGDLPGRDYFKR